MAGIVENEITCRVGRSLGLLEKIKVWKYYYRALGLSSTCSTTGFCRQLIRFLESLQMAEEGTCLSPYRVTSMYADVAVTTAANSQSMPSKD